MGYEPIVAGAWDTHVHAGPDARARKMDALTLAEEASTAEMGGLVVKNHEYPTTMLTRLVNAQEGIDINLVGTAVLNASLGGLNPKTAEAAAEFGTGRLELPTKSAKDNMLDQGEDRSIRLTVNGSLTDDAKTVLDVGIEQQMVIGTGHISVEEIQAVVEYITDRDGTVLITHPELHRARDGVGMTPEVQAELAVDGVYFERCGLVFKQGVTDHLRSDAPRSKVKAAFDKEQMLKHMLAGIEATGIQHNFLSTDFGQPRNPNPPAGLVAFHEGLLAAGISVDDLTMMARDNPQRVFEPVSA